MAKMQWHGIDEYAEQLRQLFDHSEGMIKRAVYDGAAEVANAIANEIRNLPEVNDHYYSPERRPIRGVTAAQKRGLLYGLGCSKMRNENGFINTKIGFDGYNDTRTKKYPKGQPNALIARAVNSGSSARTKIPFVNKAVKSAKERAEAAMAARFDSDLKIYSN